MPEPCLDGPQVRAKHALSKLGWQDTKALFQEANEGDSLTLGSTFHETFCTAFSKALREIRLRQMSHDFFFPVRHQAAQHLVYDIGIMTRAIDILSNTAGLNSLGCARLPLLLLRLTRP